MVPREVLERPKTGFAAPVLNWFRGELKDSFLDTVSKINIEKFIPELDANKIMEMRDDMLLGNSNNLALFKVYQYISWIVETNSKLRVI